MIEGAALTGSLCASVAVSAGATGGDRVLSILVVFVLGLDLLLLLPALVLWFCCCRRLCCRPLQCLGEEQVFLGARSEAGTNDGVRGSGSVGCQFARKP